MWTVQTSDGYEWFDESEHLTQAEADTAAEDIRRAIEADETGAADVRVTSPADRYAAERERIGNDPDELAEVTDENGDPWDADRINGSNDAADMQDEAGRD